MHSSNYASDWEAAVERTRRFDLRVPAHNVEPERRYLNAQRMAEFPYVVQIGLGGLEPLEVVAQCMMINHRLEPVMERWFGCPVIYTLGWIDDGTEKGMFRFDESFIADKLKNGHKSLKVNIHAWLTLPSMEIIDVTIATSMAVANNTTQGIGLALTRHADELEGFAYRPMLVGSDFLRRTGLMLEFSL